MRFVHCALRVRNFGHCGALMAALVLSGCVATTGNPERFIPVAVEMNALALDQRGLLHEYQIAVRTNPGVARAIRNEIITQRMYAIDVLYTQYETALTREGQDIGFGALTAATGLSTAATLVVPAATKTILSAAATGVLATKGHYESQVLLAQTMRTIQKQMRASRNIIATNIAGRMAQGVTDYPLWAALSDVEDYYNAGTLTTGVLDVSTTVGEREAETKEHKQDVLQAPLAARSSMVINGTAAPIPRPFRVARLDDGVRVGDFERQMQVSEIREIQKYLCMAVVDGKFTKQLRDTLIRRLAAKKREPTDRILRADGDFISDEILAGKKRCTS